LFKVSWKAYSEGVIEKIQDVERMLKALKKSFENIP
jgi:hypothetical protein